MNIQRLRNLTTGLLHTTIGDIYEDLETITGTSGLLSHMLPKVLDACEPWLRKHVTDPKFWDGKYDPTHIGDFKLPESSAEERKAMFEHFTGLLH